MKRTVIKERAMAAVGYGGMIGTGIWCLYIGRMIFSHIIWLGSIFVIIGISSFATVVLVWDWKKRRYRDGPITDEREEWMRIRADNAGLGALMIVWTAALLLPQCIARFQNKSDIQVNSIWLILAFGLGLCTQMVVRFIAIRRIRRRELSNDQ